MMCFILSNQRYGHESRRINIDTLIVLKGNVWIDIFLRRSIGCKYILIINKTKCCKMP